MKCHFHKILGTLKTQQKESYGFCSRKCSPTIEELAAFEEDVRLMIKNIKFRKVKMNFKQKYQRIQGRLRTQKGSH